MKSHKYVPIDCDSKGSPKYDRDIFLSDHSHAGCMCIVYLFFDFVHFNSTWMEVQSNWMQSMKLRLSRYIVMLAVTYDCCVRQLIDLHRALWHLFVFFWI
jgi:hypothetical protein